MQSPTQTHKTAFLSVAHVLTEQLYSVQRQEACPRWCSTYQRWTLELGSLVPLPALHFLQLKYPLVAY